MSKYLINKSFLTRVDRSDRVLEIAEAFGLGLDDRKFVVFENLELDVKKGDIVYITGQSGSGKSILLRELSEKVKSNQTVTDIDKIELLEKPLIDQIGENTNEGLKYLSIAGLNDAYLFVRKPSELSDGQRYRFKLAKLIESKTEVWVADEFLAVLDRVSARVIAYNMQKIARQQKATLIVATTHMDLMEDLNPDLYIEKRYREKVHVKAFNESKG